MRTAEADSPERLGPPPGIAGYRLLNLLEPPRPRRIAASPRAPLFVVATVCVGAFMGQLDASIVSVALPRMSAQLHAPVGLVQWVSLSYVLTLVALVVPIGAWADAVGRKSLYVGGFAVFTLASAACAVAPDVAVLCGCRVVQAVGAALMQANSVALIAAATPRDRLGRMVGLQAAAQATGLAAGPAVGGFLLAAGSWRWLFLVNVPAGVIGVVTAAMMLPRSRELSAARPAGAARLMRFVLSVLRAPRLARILLTSFAGYAMLFCVLVAIPLLLHGRGTSSVVTGLTIATVPVVIGLTAPVAGHLSDRAPQWVASAGFGLTLASLCVIALLRPGGVGLVGLLALAGAGLGSFTPANNRAVMLAAPRGAASTAAGLLNMTRGLGTAAGTALAVFLLG
ncbi:MAG TPA: MFS transporter [Mycobacteriales bacterium]|nr:MFS transporter [Mycobacteriales bacterium]